MTPIALIAFNNHQAQKIRDQLTELKYNASYMSVENWLKTDKNQTIDVLFLSEECSKPEIYSEISARNKLIDLVIVGDGLHKLITPISAQVLEFVIWPYQSTELKIRLQRLQKLQFRNKLVLADEELKDEFLSLNLVGRSKLFLQNLSLLKKYSRVDVTVLISGETGTGKELAARAIHYTSQRRDKPFIPINCASIPENLFENELFGHTRGAYTDAQSSQKGVIQLAEGGTLFFDEIDSLPLKSQAALLRFLQDQQFKPLGSTKFLNANIRIIVATNQNLFNLVDMKEFRQDLYFRLNILNIEMPALRNRKDDIQLLANYFVNKLNQQYDNDKYIELSSILIMMQYSWPGNVRELENILHREYLLSEGKAISIRPVTNVDSTAPDSVGNMNQLIESNYEQFSISDSFNHYKQDAICGFERRYLEWILAETKGNITLAAQYAGKERRCLGKLLKKHGIDKAKFS